MKRLVVIDFMYMAHRHLYSVREAEKKKYDTIVSQAAPNTVIPEHLSYVMSNPNTGEESARLYYIVRDVEAILSNHEGDDVIICSDRHTVRKDSPDNAIEYKANRAPDRFKELDKAAITNTEQLLQQAGVSLIAIDGYEADDLIQSVVRQYKDNYDEILIYTPDSDLAVLIDDKVSLKRYKSVYSTGELNGKHASFFYAHKLVTKDNYVEYWSDEFSKKGPVTIDYNAIMFYKTTVGDVADNIKGIQRFGNAAYTKMRNMLINNGFNQWNELNNPDKVEALIGKLRGVYLNDNQANQALDSLKLVRHYEYTIPAEILRPAASTEERKRVYSTTWGISRI